MADFRLTPDGLAAGLRTRRVGRRILVLPEVDSTNRFALALAAARGPASDGSAIFAERQTAGRGRLGRAWHAPAGAGLLMTVLLWEEAAACTAARWMMTAAVAAVDGIEAATDVTPELRWPNDLYVGGRKLGGILVETANPAQGETHPTPGAGSEEPRLAVAIGIGVNCLQHPAHFPPELRQTATSLDLVSPAPVDRSAVGRAILRALDAWVARGTEGLAAAWSARSGDIGTRATLVSEGRRFRGQIVDVDPQAGLVLQIDGGPRRHFDPATTAREA